MTTNGLTTRASRLLRTAFIGVIAIAFTVLPPALRSPTTSFQAGGDPCVNGIVPWNPYVVNCNLPDRKTPKVRGAAPDAGAIIACRGRPVCLSWYVNGP